MGNKSYFEVLKAQGDRKKKSQTFRKREKRLEMHKETHHCCPKQCKKTVGEEKRVNLSRGGRLTLCSSVLSSIPIYYLSLFVMPSHMCLDLERLMRNLFFFFLGRKEWGKVNHLVSWKSVSKSLGDGGLGLGALKHRNIALVARWGWRL